MIPKNIIYIWFGKGKKNDIIKECIKKNKTILKDWEFIEYTEDNYDISKCRYLKEAYDKQKYAFASDYARFDILYQYGGVYVDTDVEFLKTIPDDFLNFEGFSGVESNNKIASGLIFACEAGNPIVKEIIDSYESDTFIMENGNYNLLTVVDRVTSIFNKHGFVSDGTLQDIEGIKIFPCDYFCTFDFVTREFLVTDNTLSIHHYAATWIPFRKKMKRLIQNVIKTIVGKGMYRKLVEMKRRYFGISK